MADLVSSVKVIQIDKETDCYRASIVEIVGPAGAGKTTLIHALEKLGPEFKIEYLPPVWNTNYIPFFVKHILLLTPFLIQMQRGKDGRNLTRRELAWMAMLRGWPEILRMKAESEHNAILLDPGPIFLMSILSEFGPESMQYPKLPNYWARIYKQWVDVLDMVIYLDAVDEILIKRIRTRKDQHLMKDQPDQATQEFLAKYRRSYDRLITLLTTRNRNIRVLRMDTSAASVNELVQCVLLNMPKGSGTL